MKYSKSIVSIVKVTLLHCNTVMRMLGWSQIIASCEVRGVFQPLIPMIAADRLEVRTHSTVMVPDFRLELTSSTPGLNILPQESEPRLA